MAPTALATFDGRPFFEKALRYGVEHNIITPARLQIIQGDFAKGIVQIANYFGTAHLRPELELALHRMVNLISLYLEDSTGGDLHLAACSLRDKTFLSHSKGGSDMLKRLHAMPDCTLINIGPALAEDQRAYLDEKTAATTIPLAECLEQVAVGQRNQRLIDFSIWLARKMGSSREAITNEDADSLIRSAMLVLFAEKLKLADLATLRFPTRSVFVRLITTAKLAKTSLDTSRLDAFLKNAPAEFELLARDAMDRFITNDLPQIRSPGNSADKLAQGASLPFFLNESADEDVREYVRLVAKEWDRVTGGDTDDPQVLASVFLFVATGYPPKPSMLLREGKEIIRSFRTSSFNSSAVTDFIDNQAPEAMREDLKKSWSEDLKPEAETQLADNDPAWPDTHMERALEYLRITCSATWKRRGR